MQEIKFYSGEEIPLELHKVRVVQKLHLVPIERRLEALQEGGFNTFRLNTKDVFLDMLTDSGTNAMSDNQMAAMMQADDAYAGSQSFYRLQKAVEEVLGKVLPAGPSGTCSREYPVESLYQAGQPGSDELPFHYHTGTYHRVRGAYRGTALR